MDAGSGTRPDSGPDRLAADDPGEHPGQTGRLTEDQPRLRAGTPVSYTPGAPVPGSARARAAANLTAIRLARDISAEGRYATADEQQQLGQWTSWGAVPQIFEDFRDDWDDEQAQLKQLLNAEEYGQASATTVNAHYTDPEIVEAIWDSMETAGFDGGSVLEPGCGSGTFIGQAPPDASMVGVELDSTSASIASLLYPQAQIRAEGLEKSTFTEDAFSAVVGNVPFGDYVVHDGRYNASRLSIHNYFIAKSLRLCAPGGYVAVLTSTFTMDARNERARREIAKHGDLVAAVRLPNNTFRKVAGTEAAADVLIFRARPSTEKPDIERINEWVATGTTVATHRETGDAVEAPVGGWFATRPEAVLAAVTVGQGMYSDETVGFDAQGVDNIRLAEALRNELNQQIEEATDAGLKYTPAPVPGVEAFTPGLVIGGAESEAVTGHVRATNSGFEQFSVDQTWAPVRINRRHLSESRMLLTVRDAAKAVIESQRGGASPEERDSARAELNTVYDRYTTWYGPLNRFTITEPKPRTAAFIKAKTAAYERQWRATLPVDGDTEQREVPVPTALAAQWEQDASVPAEPKKRQEHLAVLKGDPDRGLLLAIEDFDEETQQAGKRAIFSRDVIALRSRPVEAATAEDALRISLDESRRVDMDRISSLLGIEPAQAREALGVLVFDDPDTGSLIPAVQYLSGNVRTKLDQARAATATDEKYLTNVDSLEGVLPDDVSAMDIIAKPGVRYVEASDYEDFVAETFGVAVSVTISPTDGDWEVRTVNRASFSAEVRYAYATPDRTPLQLLQAMMNNRTTTVRRTVENSDGSTKQVKDAKATLEARDKAAKIATTFGTWVFADATRAERVTAAYNRMFNSNVTANYASLGEGLSLPGLSPDITPHDYQRAAVARVLNEPTVLLDHVVGAGKTGSMIMSAMELRRTGIANKPAVIVPNHLVDQVSRDFMQWYPSAAVLTIPTGINEAERVFWAGSAATGDWDAVIMPATVFSSIGIDPIRTQEWVLEQVADLREARAAMGKDEKSRIKAVEKAIKRLEERHERIVGGKTPGVTFEETGIDYLFVDEAHHYKNLFRQSDSYELACAGSDRAADLDYKLRALRETKIEDAKRGGYYTDSYLPAVATFATGTPVANSLSEMWVMQHYLRPDLLERAGLRDVGSWATQFTERSTVLRVSPAGGGFEQVERINKYINVPELITLSAQFSDVITAADLSAGLPELAGGERALMKRDPSEAVVDYVQDLGERAKNLSGVDPREDNMPKITNDGRMVALDPRLKGLPADTDGGRAGQVAAQVFSLHQHHSERLYTDADGTPNPTPGALQLLFCDRAVPNSEGRFNMYEDIRDQLVELGMEPARIAFIHDAGTDDARAELFAKCRDGRVNVLIGSTERMGTGTNVQARAVAVHHVDVPWRPADLEQREGRAMRQGNQNGEVAIRSYATAGTFDVYMWDMVARKAKFINQLKSGDTNGRTMEDVFGDLELSAGQAAAALSGDPRLEQLSALQLEESRLASLHHSYLDTRRRTRGELAIATSALETIAGDLPPLRTAAERVQPTAGDAFTMTVGRNRFGQRSAAADALKQMIRKTVVPVPTGAGPLHDLGVLAGLTVHGRYNAGKVNIRLGHAGPATVEAPWDEFLAKEPLGILRRLENTAANIPDLVQSLEQRQTALRGSIPELEATLEQPFAYAEELLTLQREIEDLMRDMDLDTETEDGIDADATAPAATLDYATRTDRKLPLHQLRNGDVVTGIRGHGQTLFRAEPLDDEGDMSLVAVAAADEAPERLPITGYQEVELVSRLHAALTPFERHVAVMDETDTLARTDHEVSTGERITVERRTTDGEQVLTTGQVEIIDGVWMVTDDTGGVYGFPSSRWSNHGPVIRHGVATNTQDKEPAEATVRPIVGDILITDVDRVGQAGDVFLAAGYGSGRWSNPETGQRSEQAGYRRPTAANIQRGRQVTVAEITTLFAEGFGSGVSHLRPGDVVSAHEIDRNQARKDNVTVTGIGHGTMRDISYLFEDGTTGECRRREDQNITIHARRYGALTDHERATLQAPGKVESIRAEHLGNVAAGSWIRAMANEGHVATYGERMTILGRLVDTNMDPGRNFRVDPTIVMSLDCPDGGRKTCAAYASSSVLVWDGDLPETPLDYVGMDLPSLPIGTDSVPATDTEAADAPEPERVVDDPLTTIALEHPTPDPEPTASHTGAATTDAAPDRPVLKHSAENTSVTNVGPAANDLHRLLKDQGFKFSRRQQLWYLNSTWKTPTRDDRAAAFLTTATDSGHSVQIDDEGPTRRMALLRPGDRVSITPDTAEIEGIGEFGEVTRIKEFPPMIGEVNSSANRMRMPVTVALGENKRELNISHVSGALAMADDAADVQDTREDAATIEETLAYLDRVAGKPVADLEPGDCGTVTGKVVSLRNVNAVGSYRFDDALVLANEPGAVADQRYLLLEVNDRRAWIEARTTHTVSVTGETNVSEGGFRPPRFAIANVNDVPEGTAVSMTGVDAATHDAYVPKIVTASGTLTNVERIDDRDQATISTAGGPVTIVHDHASMPFQATTMRPGTITAELDDNHDTGVVPAAGPSAAPVPVIPMNERDHGIGL
ncbi:helicase-related protein [Arthrobacter pigmenti]